MKKERKLFTDFLFSTPDFYTGMGSVFNLSGNYYKFNVSASEVEADTKALRSDFGMVGQDFADVLSEEISKSDTKLSTECMLK